MSMETMDIEFYIDKPLWRLPSEPYIDEPLDSFSCDLDSMTLNIPPHKGVHVRNHIQSPLTNPESLPGSDTFTVWPENNSTFNELSMEYPTTLERTTMGSAVPVSLFSPQEPPIIPDNAPQKSIQDPFSTLNTNVPGTVQNQVFQDEFPCFLQSLSQSTHDMPQGNVFEAGTDPQHEQVTQEQYLSQARQKRNYGNASQFESSISFQRNPVESQDNVVTSIFEPQACARTTMDAEMYLHEPTKTTNTHSGITDRLSSQQLPSYKTANDTQQALSDIQVLETYEVDGFFYSKVRIDNPAVCPCCDQTCANISYLCKHIKRSHMNKSHQKLSCPQCHLAVRNETNLLRHIHSAHRQEEIVELCEICNAQFCSSFSATVHRRIVHGIQAATSRQKNVKKMDIFFKCNTCGSYAKEKGNMKRHVNIAHLKCRKYHCECGMAFKTKHNLDCHMISKSCLRMKV